MDDVKVVVRQDENGITRLVCEWNDYCQPSLFISPVVARKIIHALTDWLTHSGNGEVVE